MSEKSVRVLLVDDEEELLEYMSRRLLREGFTVRVAFSGAQGCQVAREEDFEVAVVDLKMPGMDGIETQKQLKAIRPFLQIIVLTGHGSLDTALESGRQDAFLYLEKPVEHDKLLGVIRDAAAKREEILMDHFREALEDITTSGGSPREIVQAVDALRKKFGLH